MILESLKVKKHLVDLTEEERATLLALASWRHLAVTERHTKQAFAAQMKWLVDEQHPQA